MVKRSIKFFAYFLFFILSLMLLIPKDSIYFLLEKNLKNYDVIISKEQLHQTPFSLKIEELDVSVKAVDTVLIGEVDATLLGFYNIVNVKEIKLSSLAEAYMPTKIASLDIHYTFFTPSKIKANAQGDFGKAKISIDLQKKLLRVEIKASKIMLNQYKSTLKLFKKSKSGEYIYAKNI